MNPYRSVRVVVPPRMSIWRAFRTLPKGDQARAVWMFAVAVPTEIALWLTCSCPAAHAGLQHAALTFACCALATGVGHVTATQIGRLRQQTAARIEPDDGSQT